MPLRPFRMPDDISVLIDLIPRCFVYPDNEAWSLRADEKESMADSFRGMRRMWPLLRVVRPFVPFLRDMMLGFVWEEDQQVVGLSNVIRNGNSDQWTIGNVGVLPDYRRRGIARKLVEASVALARERDASIVNLEVVRGNVPAAKLYEDLGFVRFSGHAQLRREVARVPEIPALPEGLTVSEHSIFDWKPRYALAQRITPGDVAQFAPVEEGRYRMPGILRGLFPVLKIAMGMDQRGWIVRDAAGDVVAIATMTLRLRAGGINTLNVTCDPAGPGAVPHVIARCLALAEEVSPGRGIDMTVQDWQPHVRAAAEAVGFVHGYDDDSMALRLRG